MGSFDAPSKCCSNVSTIFRWYGEPSCEVGKDLDVATKKFFTAIQNSSRIWTETIQSLARAQFRTRIKRASEGKLRSFHEIKPVDVVNPPPLYELRWQDIQVLEADGRGAHAAKEIHVRMYHSEPDETPNHFIGHHIHEKVILDKESTRVNQDLEIEIAKQFYLQGQTNRWDV